MRHFSTLALLLVAGTGWTAQEWRLFDSFTGFDTGSYSLGRWPNEVAFGDLDGDGDADAVVSSWDHVRPRITVLKDRGDLDFTDRKMYVSPKVAGGVALLDVDRDGDLDAFVTEPDQYGQGTLVGVYKNDGQGNLGSRTPFAGGKGPLHPVVGDFNRDGIQDVLVANYGYFGDGTTVSVLHGDGFGGFSAPLSLSVGPAPHDVEAADFNGDGWLDIAVSRDAWNGNGQQTQMGVVLSNGSGGYAPVQTYDASPTENWAGNTHSSIESADMDGDGVLDLVFTSNRIYENEKGQFLLYRGNGNGTFQSKVAHYFGVPYTQGSFALQLGDVDGDGRTDVVGTQWSDTQGNVFIVVRRDAQGGYLPGEVYPQGTGTDSILLRDLDNNGRLDLASVNSYSINITVHLNKGNGLFPRPRLSPTEQLVNEFDLGDVDGDGDLDLAGTNGYGGRGTTFVQRNDGQGNFSAPIVMLQEYMPGPIRLRDLDQDGDLDILFGESSGPNGVTLYCRWQPNNGFGTFGTAQIIETPMAMCTDVDAVDLNADGKLDVVAIDGIGSNLQTALNQGGGSFGPAFRIAGPNGIDSGTLADFNKDGKLDIAVVANIPYGYFHQMGVSYGNGDGTFTPFTAYNSDDWPNGIDTGDLNNDGNLDVAIVSCGFENDPSPSYSVYLGKPDGTFLTERRYVDSALGFSGDLRLKDLNGDGKLDMAIANYDAHTIGVYTGKGDGTFGPQVHYGIGPSPQHFDLRDVTGDQTVDMVGFTYDPITPIALAYVAVIPGRQRALTVPVEEYRIIRGQLVNGTLGSLLQSDDQRLEVKTGLVINQTEAPVNVEFDATSPAAFPSQLSFTLEGHASTANLTQRLELWNFDTAAFELVDVRNSTLVDSTVKATVANNAGRFVEAGTRRLRGRVTLKAVGPVFTSSWIGRFDLAEFQVVP